MKKSKKEKKHSKTRETDKPSKQVEENPDDAEIDLGDKKRMDVGDKMNRATVLLHGVDNA